MGSYAVPTFDLSDGTKIPWLAWGNGSGNAAKTAVVSGQHALNAGIRHIDTAQLYKNEEATGEVVAKSGLDRADIYITTKLSEEEDGSPTPLDKVRSKIDASLRKLGFVPDLLLIHNPFAVEDILGTWKILEELKAAGELKSIGVSNFRPQDLNLIIDSNPRYLPVVNQLEYHPYVLSHIAPVLEIQAKYGIITESFGPLAPIVKHPTGGPLKPVLERIAARLSESTGKPIDAATVLFLWTRAQGVVAVTASGNPDNIAKLGAIAVLPDLLQQSEIDEITEIGKKHHFRHYTEHMEVDFPVPDLPSGL